MSTDQQHQKGWPINDLWEKYEEIAMHFNDLLIRLRTQALGAVAAISALIGVFGKTDSGLHSWHISAAVFFFLCVFWIAIWVIDFRYYHLLLIGAVDAIIDLENLSKTETHITHIDISTRIEQAVAGELRIPKTKAERDRQDRLRRGPRTFYMLVFAALLMGLIVSLYEAGLTPTFVDALKSKTF